jgi:hypothetical protein
MRFFSLWALFGGHHRAGQTLARQLKRDHRDALVCQYPASGRLQTTTINETAAERWQPFVSLLTETELTFTPIAEDPVPPLTFTPGELRWFGRPRKYEYVNELWMHFERGERWQLVRLRLTYTDTLRHVRALKTLAPGLVTPYRRRRPYIHYGPLAARTATQDLYGAWTLHEALSVYLMPLHLVLLEGARVQTTIPIETVTHVRGVPRLDAPGGVVRFQTGETVHALAVESYRPFAEALAEAARRSLEQPLELLDTKRKKKRPDD